MERPKIMINPKTIQTINELLDEILRDLKAGKYVTTAIAADLAKKELSDLIQIDGEPGIIMSVGHAYSLTELVRWFKVMVTKTEHNQLTPEYCDNLIEALKC